MAKKLRAHELVELESSHEDGAPRPSADSPGTAPCAVSAAQTAQTAATTPVFPCEQNGINISPKMAFRLLFDGTRTALFAPTGDRCVFLSGGLSLLHLAVGPRTARKYAHALRRMLDAGRADQALLAQLENAHTAHRAVLRLLANAGCKLQHHRLPGGAVLVTAPEPLVDCIDTGLTVLGHCYTLLGDRGAIDFDPIHGAAAEITPLPGAPTRRRMRQFVLANRRHSHPLTADPHCTTLVRTVARQWPPGIAAAATFTAEHAQRISETLDLDVADWAKFGFGDRVACPNKGSGGIRTKTLYLSPTQHDDLARWIDGPRQQLTGVGLAELKKLHDRDPAAPELHQPLFLNTRGRRISYSLFNDYYWRPALRAAGSAATPHCMRHERVGEDLLSIREMGLSPGEEEQLVRVLASLIGWASGPDMVYYYADWLIDQDQRALLTMLAERKAAPPAPRVPGPNRRPIAMPAVLAAFAGEAAL